MKTLIVEDVRGDKSLINLDNVLAVQTGGGVYDSRNTNMYIKYGFDQVVSFEILESDTEMWLQKIQSVLEND